MVATPIKSPSITWESLPTDYVLPDDPVENIQQPMLAAALSEVLRDYIKPEMLIVSNFGLVATVNKKIVVKAPDWLYVPKVYPVATRVIRRSYTQNLEGDPVAIVMEFLSDSECGELSVRSTPPFGKFYFYEQILQVPTYVTYDPYECNLEVRCLDQGKYVLQSADALGRFWIQELELFLGIWTGERLGHNINWLRWWDASGNLLLWSFEQAELEHQRANLEQQRAEQEYQRAEQERQGADILAAKLQELGIDPLLLL
jgi:Uma2 family endonuclease